VSVRVRLSDDEVEVIDDALSALRHMAAEYDPAYADPTDVLGVAEVLRKRAVLGVLIDRFGRLR
jgi:hypothetical protein